MNKTHQCHIIRDKIFDYRRGDLSEVDRALFEDQLLECSDCALYIERIIEMMDLAGSEDAWVEPELKDDAALPDRMFDAILGQIAVDGSVPSPTAELDDPAQERAQDDAHAPVVQLHFPQVDDDTQSDEELQTSGNGWRFGLIAAVVVVACGAAYMWGQRSVIPQTPSTPKVATKKSEPKKDTAPEPEQKLQEQPVLAKLKLKKSDVDAIKVFANNNATWKVIKQDKHHTLHLDKGTILVEFLPKDGETMSVVAGKTKVNVVGTVFYVSQAKTTSRPRVGVLTGRVRVERRQTTKDDAPVQVTTLSDGQAIDPVQPGVQAVHQEDVTQDLVDLKKHRDTLALNASKAEAPERQVKRPAPPTVAKKVVPARPSVDTLRKSAHKALVEQQFKQAASLNEQLLKRLGRRSAEAASVQLELANLYMVRLGDKKRAAKHLKRFVDAYPHDVATPNARKQLCALLGDEAASEPQCPTRSKP